MPDVILYVATSLDGYIARADGSVDWLDELPAPTGEGSGDYGYGEFIAGVGVVLMGRVTYEQVLSFDVDYPYTEQEGYVFSRTRAGQRDEYAQFVAGDDIPGLVAQLKEKGTGHIWLVGGGQLVREFLALDLVDRIELFILPTVLGEGIPLFPPPTPRRNLNLASCQSYDNGMVHLSYVRSG